MGVMGILWGDDENFADLFNVEYI